MSVILQQLNCALFDEGGIQKFRQLLKDHDIELQQKFDPRHSVAKLLREKSAFIDKVLSLCWQHFLGEKASQLCLLAVGGYGRRELFPYSDIDILALLVKDDKEALSALSNFFTFLWDIGLKLGHSVRTVKECVSLAKDDQTIMTSLMENRLVVGSAALHKTLKQQIGTDKIWPSDLFFAAKMEEQQQRYAKFHDTAYNLEPNIKEGPGGLRDRQVISWVFKRHYNVSSIKELIKYDFLPESEYQELMAALEVLWRIRYALHVLTKRAEDRLVFDYQRELARQFGFYAENQEYNQDVEQFMQFYFKTVQGLERLNEMLLQLFQERFVNKHAVYNAIGASANFISINGYLEAIDDNVFERCPSAMLEIFVVLAQNVEALKGVRATTIRLIRKHLHLIDEDFRNNHEHNKLFVAIFRQPDGVTRQLRRMNRYGVLAAYLPSFANIVARMQYDLFHIYTVDVHTLFVLRNLRRFSLAKHEHELPFCNAIFPLIAKPEVLYFAALFHDIAKGKRGDHSQLGEVIARDFCRQHQLSAHDTRLIIWLVRHHLIMSMTAQRKDISDLDVIHAFAQQVGSLEYLNHLYLLTVADIRATNPELWNSWKDSLLKDLYSATHKVIRKGLQNPLAVADRIAENKQGAIEELHKLGMLDSEIEFAWQHTSDDYFLRYSADEIAWHTQAIASVGDNNLPLVLLRTQTQKGNADIFIYTIDNGPIFSICTATLDQLGLSILDARIITTSDNYVLNSFQVLEQSGEPTNEKFRESHICNTLRHNLLNHEVKEVKNIHRLSRQAKHFPIPTSIQFAAEPTGRYTILELVTTDYAGLLSHVGKAFVAEDINLHSAKITTIGSRAEDIFYITDRQSQPINEPEKQERLRHTLLKTLEIHWVA